MYRESVNNTNTNTGVLTTGNFQCVCSWRRRWSRGIWNWNWDLWPWPSPLIWLDVLRSAFTILSSPFACRMRYLYLKSNQRRCVRFAQSVRSIALSRHQMPRGRMNLINKSSVRKGPAQSGSTDKWLRLRIGVSVAWLPTEYDRRSNERLITPAWLGLSLCLDSFIGSA